MKNLRRLGTGSMWRIPVKIKETKPERRGGVLKEIGIRWSLE